MAGVTKFGCFFLFERKFISARPERVGGIRLPVLPRSVREVSAAALLLHCAMDCVAGTIAVAMRVKMVVAGPVQATQSWMPSVLK